MPDQPRSGAEELAPHPLPDPKDDPVPEGSNATIHHPDDRATEHPAREDRKPRDPYVAGNV